VINANQKSGLAANVSELLWDLEDESDRFLALTMANLPLRLPFRIFVTPGLSLEVSDGVSSQHSS
jgi:hypothetical protein